MWPDTDVLRRAYLTPLANPRVSARIFWPFMVLYGVGDQLFTLNMSVPILGRWGLSLLAPAMMLAAWPMFAAGAIRWHRWLVLEEPAAVLSLSGSTRLCGYFGRTVAVAAIAFAVLLALAVFAFVPFVFSSSKPGEVGFWLTGLTLIFKWCTLGGRCGGGSVPCALRPWPADHCD